MAQIIIDVPNAADVTRALDAFAATFGWQPTISQGGSQVANPETKAAFAKRQTAIWIKSIVSAYESQLAASSARTTAEASANALNIT